MDHMKLRARTRLLGLGIIGTFVVVGCGSSTSGGGGAGGTSGSGGSGATSVGGAHGGSAGKGGSASGGTSSGGSANHAGSAGESGGTAAGGSSSGGTASGGSATGGSANGGAANEAGASGEGGAPAVCASGDKRCVSATQLETCAADGQWGTPSDCEFGCTSDACATNYALSFDGTDDIVTVPFASDLDVTNAFTIEAWVDATSANGGGIASMWGEGGLPDKLLLQLTGGDVVGRIAVAGQTTVSATMPLNTWTHVALSYDGATMLLYLNGVQAGSTDIAGALPLENLPFRLGIEDVNLGVRTFFNGSLDEVRFWNVARSAADIAANYQASISPTSTGLIAYWNFNEAQSSQTVTDITTHGNNGTLGADNTVASDDPVRVAR